MSNSLDMYHPINEMGSLAETVVGTVELAAWRRYNEGGLLPLMTPREVQNIAELAIGHLPILTGYHQGSPSAHPIPQLCDAIGMVIGQEFRKLDSPENPDAESSMCLPIGIVLGELGGLVGNPEFFEGIRGINSSYMPHPPFSRD